MPSTTTLVRLAVTAGFVALAASQAEAQGATPAPAKPARAPFCAKGVRIYNDRSQVPAPYDTLRMPPAEPVRVTSPEEMEAAELAMRGRAGSVGANVVLVTDETTEINGEQRLRRSVQALYVRADSARSVAACK